MDSSGLTYVHLNEASSVMTAHLLLFILHYLKERAAVCLSTSESLDFSGFVDVTR